MVITLSEIEIKTAIIEWLEGGMDMPPNAKPKLTWYFDADKGEPWKLEIDLSKEPQA